MGIIVPLIGRDLTMLVNDTLLGQRHHGPLLAGRAYGLWVDFQRLERRLQAQGYRLGAIQIAAQPSRPWLYPEPQALAEHTGQTRLVLDRAAIPATVAYFFLRAGVAMRVPAIRLEMAFHFPLWAPDGFQAEAIIRRYFTWPLNQPPLLPPPSQVRPLPVRRLAAS